MKCPECRKTFDPWTAQKRRVNKKNSVQCPHCKEWIDYGR